MRTHEAVFTRIGCGCGPAVSLESRYMYMQKIKAHLKTRFTLAVCAVVCGSRCSGGQLVESRGLRSSAASAIGLRATAVAGGGAAGTSTDRSARLAIIARKSGDCDGCATAQITSLVSLEIKPQFHHCTAAGTGQNRSVLSLYRLA